MDSDKVYDNHLLSDRGQAEVTREQIVGFLLTVCPLYKERDDMKLIDADALDRAFSKLRFNNDGELEHYGDRPNWYLWGSEVENLIANAPTIDIVRCKECRHGTYCEEAEMYICNANDQDLYEAEHFCSYGEREGE